MKSSADPRAEDAVLDALADPDAGVREAAAGALKHEDARSREAWARLLEDREGMVRRRAASNLAVRFKDRRALGVLLGGVNDPDPLVRSQAVGALGYIDDPSSFRALESASKDPDERVRSLAAEGLWKPGRGPRPVRPPLPSLLLPENLDLESSSAVAILRATAEAVARKARPSPAATSAGGSVLKPVRVGGGIPEPKLLRKVNPTYPAAARAQSIQGVVILQCTLAPDGSVSEAKVLRGVPELNDAAVEAVRQWVYTPTTVNGVAVPVIMTVTVNFRAH